MPTIKDKLYFNFNEVSSSTYGLVNINFDGMFEETLVASRNINETVIRGNSKPLFHSVDDSPLEFDMTIAFENGFDDTMIDNVIKWLFVGSYRPLYFEGKENRVYYCMPIGESTIAHNGLNKGYLTITMRCDSSNLYSQVVTSDLTNVVTESTITLQNDGHFDVYPEISIKKNGVGTIVIESLDDNGNIFEIRDLTNLEDIYLNCEKEIIVSDVPGVYRYDKMNGEVPRLVIGQNRFKITGNCTIQFRYKNKYKF